MKRLLIFQIAYTVIMAFIFVMVWNLARTKGWFIIPFFMPLFVVIPLIALGQFIMLKQYGQRRTHPRALVAGIGQLVSMLVFYICLPGMGDTDIVYMFGSREMVKNDPIVQISGFIAVAAFIFWIITTILFIRYLRRPVATAAHR